MIDIERLKGRAEQLKGKVEQTVGRVTGSKETQARGIVDEAKGKALETVAKFRGQIKQEAGEARAQLAEIRGNVRKHSGKAQKQLAAIRGKAKAALTGLNPTSVVVALAGAIILIAINRTLPPSRRADSRHPEPPTTSS